MKTSIKVVMVESLYIETPVYRHLGQLYYNFYCETHNQQPFRKFEIAYSKLQC